MTTFNYDHIVVRYGELSTKGKNRKDFTKALTNNIKKRLRAYPELSYRTLHDGLYIELNGENYELIKEDLKQVFGYAYFSGAILVDRDIEEIKKTALELTKKKDYKTFKMVSKRSDKSFPLRSDEINRQVAGHVLRNSDLKVDVHNQDLKIYVVINQDNAVIMDEKIRGIGGYPTGVNGRAMLMMSGGIDSPVAGYLTMKRGLKIECIHFASEPYTSAQAKEKVFDLARQLSVYQGDIIIHVIPFTELQLAIYKHANESYAITIMRRMMYRICESLAYRVNAKCIVNGESVGQVASQTLTSMMAINEVIKMPVIRPVACFDKLDIIDISKKINTYDISIRPFEDCCTIFVPEHPVINPDINKAREYEKLIDYETLIKEALKNEEIIKLPIVNNNFTDIL